MINCCRNCTNRTVTCHSTCELYRAQKEAADAENYQRYINKTSKIWLAKSPRGSTQGFGRKNK